MIVSQRGLLFDSLFLLGLSKIDLHGSTRQINEFNCLLLIAKKSIVKYKFSNAWCLEKHAEIGQSQSLVSIFR